MDPVISGKCYSTREEPTFLRWRFFNDSSTDTEREDPAQEVLLVTPMFLHCNSRWLDDAYGNVGDTA